MARSLAPWRRLVNLRTRLAEGEQALLKESELRLQHSEHAYHSYAFAGSQKQVRADELGANQLARDASWQQVVLGEKAVAERMLRWQQAKRQQRQAELLLERHVQSLRDDADRRERLQQEDWLRARDASEQRKEA